MQERVTHRTSGQRGVLIGGRGRWYVSVRFDGDDHTSTVARDSVEPSDEETPDRGLISKPAKEEE